MPFLARCLDCNHIVWAMGYPSLHRLINAHNDRSHKGRKPGAELVQITWNEFIMYEASKHNPEFWKAVNTKRKRF